jgi:hypothetical protein
MPITNSVLNNFSLVDNYEHDDGYVQQIRQNQTEGVTSSSNEHRSSLKFFQDSEE